MGTEYLDDWANNRRIEPYQLRETCFLPFKIALESRSAKLATLAVSGLQKLLSDERFHSNGHNEKVEYQFPVQFFNAVVSTPSLSDEVQVEVMKLLLLITSSESCEVHDDYLIKIAEVCIETYVRAHQSQTKTACRATLTQMLSSVCHRLQDSSHQKTLIMRKHFDNYGADQTKLLSQDVVSLLKYFSMKLQSFSSTTQQSNALALYLESVQVMLLNLSKSMQQDREFVNLVWQILCPSLIQLLGSPSADVNTRGKPVGYSGFPDEGRGARGGSNKGGKYPTPLIARTIYAIAGELVRLVGTMQSLRPTLESLFHRIILYPPPHHRIEALKIIKELLGSPQRIYDLAGPTKNDRLPGTPESPTEQRKTDLDLFRLIMDGIQDSCHHNEATVSSASVSCVVALLGTLEDLSNGGGLTDDQIEKLSKVKEPDNWMELYGKAVPYDDGSNLHGPSLKCGNLEGSDTESDSELDEKPDKPKHIRWQMDYVEHDQMLESDDESGGNMMTPKTVTWAPEHEERIIESYSTSPNNKGRSKPDSSRRSCIPKPKLHYSGVKSRTDSGLKSKSKRGSQRDYLSSSKLQRSYSAVDLKPRNVRSTMPVIKHPLRRTNSYSSLEIKKKDILKAEDIKVDFAFFDKFRKSSHSRKGGHNKKKEHTFAFGGLRRRNSKSGAESPMTDEGLKSPKPILRRSSSFKDDDKINSKDEPTNDHQESRQIPRLKDLRNQQGSPSKETTINGIPLSRLHRQKPSPKTHKPKSKPKIVKPEPEEPKIEPEKSVEECEKEGARNFARCLLGILPSVLAATEPSVADEALQQFASDVCEAVSCMTLKRKNVPNFGTVRTHEISSNDVETEKDPSLNADGVYKTVYATLKLSYTLNTSGYYKKRGVAIPLAQDQFIDSIISSGVKVRLSKIWLREVYRLVITYDILSKAGYKSNSNETNRALVGLLSESIYTHHPSRLKDSNVSPVKGETDFTMPAKREGTKFARRLLLCTWDQALEVLAVPLDTTTKIIAGNGSVGLAMMLGSNNDSPIARKHLSRDRDMVCLSLDGFRRAARLCCTLDIQSRCDMILSRLAVASCGDFFNDKKYRSQGVMGSVRLHAAHVLSMDALLAAGLELGSNAPQSWMHVFRCCMYISHLEHASFNSSETSSVSSSTQNAAAIAASPMSDVLSIADSDMSVDSTMKTEKPTPGINGVLTAEDACRAVYALSSAVDNLFDMAATTLPIRAFRAFLHALTEASHQQLYGKENRFINFDTSSPQDNDTIQQQMITMNTLHLYHICDVMLRCARNNNRPLIHVMEAWSIISSHLIEAAYHKARHVSKVALTSIHDILSEMLKRRSELPHFWFYDSLFKPFNTLMGLDVCDNEIQDQILYTVYELVEGFSQSLKSGWRSLFGALSNTKIYNRHAIEEFNDCEQRRKLVFNIIENFVNVKSTNVFSSAVVSAILCLLKFLRGGNTADEDDSFELTHYAQSDDRSETDSSISEVPSESELCEPTLNVLSQISKRLSNIYIQPSSAIFYGSYSILLVNMAESQGKVWDDSWSQSSSTLSGTLSPDNENKNHPSHTASSIVAIDDTGILRVWFLLLEGLTTNVTTSPKKFQPMIIELLFEILRSITTVPGPHFSMFVISNLVLPMLHCWVQRGSRKKSYWDSTLNNFKHACGLATQLVVEEIGHFLSVEGATDCVPVMLKQLLDLFHECISQPVEAIARLGCSCLRHLLLSAGPQFSEELWHILCKGITKIIESTLSYARELCSCFQSGSTSVSGDNGMVVKIVARRDVTPLENVRLMQIAEQVFLLESQISASSPWSETALDEDDNRSYIFVISTSDESDSTKIRITFRALTVSLLANQILVQMLGSMLLESAESVRGSILSTITESGLIKRNNEDSSLPGLLCYLSPINLGILFDCLMESYSIANEYNVRPGLRSLVQKLARFSTPSNLLRQSITSFAFYLNTLFQISRHDGENFSISNIKRILTGEKVHLEISPESPLKIETPKSIQGGRYRDLLKGDVNIDWIIRRLYDACNQISDTYQKLHQSDIFSEQDSGYQDAFSASFSSLLNSPQKHNGTESSEESLDITRLIKGTHIEKSKFVSPFRHKKRNETTGSDGDVNRNARRREDELLQLAAWSQLIMSMLELLLGLPTLQFKTVLPAVFPAVTSLINTVHDPKVRQLVCDVVRRCGAIYGII